MHRILWLFALMGALCSITLPASAADDYHACIAPSNTIDTDEQIAACSRYLDQTGRPVTERKSAFWQRGKLYEKSKKDYSRALADYDQLVALDPKDAHSYFLRGWGHIWKHYANKDEKECASARQDFDQANVLNPQKYHFKAEFYDNFGCGKPDSRDDIKLFGRDY